MRLRNGSRDRIGGMSVVPAGRRAPQIVLVLGGLLVIALVSTIFWVPTLGVGDLVLFGIAMAYFLVLGVLILTRVPGNRIGWLFALIALSIGASGLLGAVGDLGNRGFSAVAGALWMFWIGLGPLLLLWFPTGRPPTRRWRVVEFLVYTAIATAVLTAVFAESLCQEGEAGQCLEWVDNPIGIAGVPHPEYSEPIGVMLIAGMAASVAAIFWRYRSAGATERLQLKWFLLAASLFFGSILFEIVYESGFGVEAPDWVGVVNAAGILAIPIAATIAILRYRLFEIDRIISRTVSYALVVGLLAAAVAAVAAVAGSRFDEPWVVAATTLGVAALFNPVRGRVHVWVDRRFNRSRYDAERVMEGFVTTLRGEVQESALVEGWVGVVSETMQPSAHGVWVRR